MYLWQENSLLPHSIKRCWQHDVKFAQHYIIIVMQHNRKKQLVEFFLLLRIILDIINMIGCYSLIDKRDKYICILRC